MRRNPIPILSTRKLSDELIVHLFRMGFDVEALDFICTQTIDSPAIKKEIQTTLLRTEGVIFTSQEAVKSVALMSKGIKPQWKIYCVGQATKEFAALHFGSENILFTAPNSMLLAQYIVKHADASEFTFFCGDKRRDELPEMFRINSIPLKEVVVYNTRLTPHQVTKLYAGILFYSPSTVQSFFINNCVPESTILFAIGHTTAAEIRKYCSNQIIISDQPAKDQMIRALNTHFSSRTSMDVQ